MLKDNLKTIFILTIIYYTVVYWISYLCWSVAGYNNFVGLAYIFIVPIFVFINMFLSIFFAIKNWRKGQWIFLIFFILQPFILILGIFTYETIYDVAFRYNMWIYKDIRQEVIDGIISGDIECDEDECIVPRKYRHNIGRVVLRIDDIFLFDLVRHGFKSYKLIYTKVCEGEKGYCLSPVMPYFNDVEETGKYMEKYWYIIDFRGWRRIEIEKE